MEQGEKDIMKRKPRSAADGIFANGMLFDVIFQGVIITILTLLAYAVGHYIESGRWEFVNSADGTTMAFLTLSMVQIFHSFNMRSRRVSIFRMSHQNKFLWLSMIASYLGTTAVIYVPFLSNAFGFESISVKEYGVAMGLAIMIIPIVEIVKAVKRAASGS